MARPVSLGSWADAAGRESALGLWNGRLSNSEPACAGRPPNGFATGNAAQRAAEITASCISPGKEEPMSTYLCIGSLGLCTTRAGARVLLVFEAN